jgi:hypothetical protein
MALESPILDDRRFEDLVKEVRARIPRYTPEWTDHNLSDPGITLIQLFAWLGEIILYRLNRVPEKNYIEFLKLIGIEQKQAVPATAELTFTLNSSGSAYVIVPKGTRVGAEASSEPPSALASPTLPEEPEDPVVFETEETLIAIAATLANVQVFDGASYVEYTQANSVYGEHYYPFGRRVRTNSALLLGFTSDTGFPAVEINLAVRVYRDPASTTAYHAQTPGVADDLQAALVWEYWNGTRWQTLSILKDETRAMTESGHVYFRGPEDITADLIGAVAEARYWIRCRVSKSYYDIAPELEAVSTNTVRARAVSTITDEVVGSSNGTANQIFTLQHVPVWAGDLRPVEERLADKPSRYLNESEQAAADEKLQEQEFLKGFLLEVDEGDGLSPWEEVEDFYNSGSDDRHYVLDRSSGQISFGDGAQGRIPLAGIENIVVRYYRYGGGENGNAGVGAIQDLQSSVSGVDSVTNLWPAEGGSDEEDIEDTKARAPKVLKARDRAVTSQDFEFLAMQTPGVRVRRAHALPLYHPDFPDIEVPGVITVMVIPESEDPNPVPTEVTMKAVSDYLNERRLLTTELYVVPPKYNKVEVELTITAKATANAAQIQTDVQSALNAYLNPLTGGSDEQGWPLGGDVLHSEVFRVVLEVDGVQRIEELRIVIDGVRKNKCENAEVKDDYLIYSDGHNVTVLTSI